MKIVLVHNSYREPGGEDVVVSQECQLLERSGHQVVVYRRSNDEAECSSIAGRLQLVSRIVWARDTCQEFGRLLRSVHPDLVHIHNTFYMVSPSIYSVCRQAHVPVVQTLHNYRLFCPAATFYRKTKVCQACVKHSLWRSVRYGCYRESRPATAAVALMLAAHRKLRTWTDSVDCYVALSEFARRKFVEAGLPAAKIFVKPNFVDPDPGARIGTGDYVLFLGRLSPEKGAHTALAAWRLLPDVPLVVGGDGPERQELEAQAAQWRLVQVSFRGHLTRSESLATIKGARFLILPSEWYENFPVTIAEAFACGVPVICSRLGAIQEIVAHGRTGLHFTPGNPESLAGQVDWAWHHRQEMAEMGHQARREYESKYTARMNYPRLLEIYTRAIGAHSRAVA